MSTEEIERLQATVADLESKLSHARKRLNEALCAEHPFQPGQVVHVDSGRRSYVGRVLRLRVSYGRIEMEIAKQLKSGNFSTFGTKVYSYDKVSPVS